jgi:glycosyltransferase involved in cell wall biosynthesis
MRIAILAPDLRNGSVAGVALRHARELSARHSIHVITRAAPLDLPADVQATIVRPSNWNWLRRYCHVPNELAFLWSTRRALAQLCARARPDVVWCHSHALVVLAASPLRSRFGFKIVMTTHGDIFDRPEGTYSRELTWFYRGVTPRAYRTADAVHVLSPNMAALATTGGALPDHVHVIPSGIDASEIGLDCPQPRQAEAFAPQGKLRLLYVGSLWRVKGPEVLLRAAAALRPLDAEVHVIGEGPEGRALKSLAAELGISDSVIFHGHVPRESLAAHYSRADLMCVPSLSEALSLVTLEAMLCGLPVVGSNTGGIPSLVSDGETGYLATPGDPASLASCIRKAARSREHLASLGALGQARARADFAWPVIGGRLSALAEETVARTAASGSVANGAAL